MSGKQVDLFAKSDIAAVLSLSVFVLVGGVIGICAKSRAVVYPEVVVRCMSPDVSKAKQTDGRPGVVTRELLAENRIDINTAPADSLALLPGIGPRLSERIVEHRRREGLFGTPEDLMRVAGIGPAKLAAIRDMITVGD